MGVKCTKILAASSSTCSRLLVMVAEIWWSARLAQHGTADCRSVDGVVARSCRCSWASNFSAFGLDVSLGCSVGNMAGVQRLGRHASMGQIAFDMGCQQHCRTVQVRGGNSCRRKALRGWSASPRQRCLSGQPNADLCKRLSSACSYRIGAMYTISAGATMSTADAILPGMLKVGERLSYCGALL